MLGVVTMKWPPGFRMRFTSDIMCMGSLKRCSINCGRIGHRHHLIQGVDGMTQIPPRNANARSAFVKRRRLLRFLWTGRPFSQTREPNQRSTIARTSTEWLYNIIFALGTTS